MPNLRCLTIIPSIYSNRTVDVLEATDDGLGLWLGEGRAILPECSTSLKSKIIKLSVHGGRGYIAFT